MTFHLFNQKKGFTLIEVMVAVGILAFGLIALLRLFAIGFLTSRRAQDYTTATVLAQQTIERIKRDGYGATGTGTVEDRGDFDDPTTPNFEHSRFEWETTFDEIETDLRQASVLVFWPVTRSDPDDDLQPFDEDMHRSVELVTYIADYPRESE